MLSPIYCNEQYTLKYLTDELFRGPACFSIHDSMIFNNPMLCLPSVTILRIYIQDNMT